MKKHIRKIWSVMLAGLLCMAFVPVTAQAAETIATATIPVSVTVSGEEGTLEADIPTETYTFTLTALDGAPMPESNTVTINGAGNAEFTINYDHIGAYQYTLMQDTTSLSGDNSSCNDRGNYDSTVYYITVSVVRAEDNSVSVVVGAHKGSSDGDKCEIEFDNTYDPVPYTSISVNKTWTDNDQTRPDSVEVQLLDGDEVIETVTLKEGNNWSYTWTGLDPYGEHSWDVQEVAVSGYTAEYSTSTDGTITIHNVGDKEEETETETEEPTEPVTEPETEPETTTTTSDNPQTGDDTPIALYSVIMVLAAAVIAGLLVYNKKRKTE